MRKNAIILGVCLLAVCLLGGCNKDPAPADPATAQSTTATARPERPEALPAEGVLSCERTGDTVSIRVTLAECAGEEVSLLALCDLAYQYTWWENPDACLSDLGQLLLDDQGEGNLELKLKGNEGRVYILLTASCGYSVAEVN